MTSYTIEQDDKMIKHYYQNFLRCEHFTPQRWSFTVDSPTFGGQIQGDSVSNKPTPVRQKNARSVKNMASISESDRQHRLFADCASEHLEEETSFFQKSSLVTKRICG